jgi:hypothetical protein
MAKGMIWGIKVSDMLYSDDVAKIVSRLWKRISSPLGDQSRNQALGYAHVDANLAGMTGYLSSTP